MSSRVLWGSIQSPLYLFGEKSPLPSFPLPGSRSGFTDFWFSLGSSSRPSVVRLTRRPVRPQFCLDVGPPGHLGPKSWSGCLNNTRRTTPSPPARPRSDTHTHTHTGGSSQTSRIRVESQHAGSTQVRHGRGCWREERVEVRTGLESKTQLVGGKRGGV